jgi:predicted transcriptional regulator
MKLAEIADQLALEVQTAKHQLYTEVTGGYASDLLSCVIAKAQAGNIWITLQGHPNVVAVASLLNLAGVVITEGMVPETATLQKAEEEGIPVMTTPLTAYTVAGKLFTLGVRGVDKESE